MLARTWRGATRFEDAERYLDYLRKTGLAEYARIPGHRCTLTLRRTDGDRAEFLIVSLWHEGHSMAVTSLGRCQPCHNGNAGPFGFG